MIRVLDRTNPRNGSRQHAPLKISDACPIWVGARTSICMDKYLQIYVAPLKVDSGKGPKPVPDHGSMCNVGDHDSRCFVETLAGCRTQGCLFVLPELSL